MKTSALRRFNELRLRYNVVGLDPHEGFVLRRSIDVWTLLVALPMVTGALLGASLVAGFLGYTVALFAAVPLFLVTVYAALATLAWLHWRGWAPAIMDIEHRRRKSDTWGAWHDREEE